MGIANKNKLPSSWDTVNLGEIVNIKYGKGLPTKKLTKTGYPVFGANGIIGFYTDYLYEEEQVLISCRGAYSGKINWSPAKCYITNNSLVLETPSEIKAIKKYLFYALQSADKSKIVTGSAQPQVTINNVIDLIIPLAPRDEQKRIVAEIEKQFSRLDEAVDNLKRVKANLKRYKASVLKAAVEGRLTEEWRVKNKDVEPADKLLERILVERRKKWEEVELAKMRAKGKEPKNDKWKKKYKVPVLPGSDALSPLPEGWTWVTLQNVFDVITDGDHQAPPKSETGIPLLVIGNVNTGRLDFGDTRFVPEEYYESLAELRTPKKGDLLYTVVGSYGIPVKVDTDREFCVQRHIAILKPSVHVSADYLYYALGTNGVYEQATEVATGTAQKTVSLGGLRNIVIPFPTVAEQVQIVDEIERRLSAVQQVLISTEASEARAERLRQSILKRAFAGELLPQSIDRSIVSVSLEMEGA